MADHNLFKQISTTVPKTHINPSQFSLLPTAQNKNRNSLIGTIGRSLQKFNERTINFLASLSFTTGGGSQRPSPRLDMVQRQWSEPHLRRAFCLEIDSLLVDDPLLLAALITLTHSVGEDFSVTILDVDPKEDPQLYYDILIARRIFDNLKKLIIKGGITGWAEAFYAYGDVFVQIILNAAREIVELRAMPTAGLERLSNYNDQFDNPIEAYFQRDVATWEAVPDPMFPDYLIVHGRYLKRPGDRYGRSGLIASRQSSRDAIDGYATLSPRRRMSHPKEVHILKDTDGQGFDDDVVKLYEQTLPGNLVKQGIFPNPYQALICNGATEVKMLETNARFNEMGDLEGLVERELATLKVPRSLVGGSPTVNWATLDKQREELFAAQSIFCRHFTNEVLRPIFDRALLFAGINPDSIVYNFEWGQRLTTEQLQGQSDTAMEAYDIGLLSRKSAVRVVLQFFGRTDVEEEIKQIDLEREEGIGPLAQTPQQDAASGRKLRRQFRLENKASNYYADTGAGVAPSSTPKSNN